MDGAKLLGQKLRDLGVLIPKIMSATVVSDFADPSATFVVLDTAPNTPAPAQSLMGSWGAGTRVKCLAYPPRGLLILGSNATETLALTALRLRLLSSEDVSLVSTLHAFQIGQSTGQNIRMDENEILSVSNGVAGNLNLQTNGGRIEMFDQVDGVADFNDSGYLSTVMEHKWDSEPTNQTNYNATAGSLGSADAGFSFIAPPSGAGTFQVAGFGQMNVIGMVGKYWGEIRTGGTIGAGTLVHDGDSDNGPEIRVQATANPTAFYVGSGSTLVSGLTPGNTYNASGWYAVVAAGGLGAGIQMFARQLSWIPSP